MARSSIDINDIKEKGFKLNGSEDDFGDAAYFKSPSFDHKDDADFKGWLDYRRSVGAAIPKAYENASKYDTVNIAGGFAGKGFGERRRKGTDSEEARTRLFEWASEGASGAHRRL
jgi:hypothetical protein